MDMKQFARPLNTRRESNGHLEKTRAGRLTPFMVVPFGQNEGGYVTQSIVIEADPVAGRLTTPPTATIDVVGVPVQAAYALANPTDPVAHLTDVIRQRLIADQILFPLEDDNQIAMRCAVNPTRIGGVARVCSAVRIGHNAAVNSLRLSKYWKAQTILHSNTAITPAIIGRTALDRLNAVLSPDHRINGSVQIVLPQQRLQVDGFNHYGPNASAPASITIDANNTTIGMATSGINIARNLFATLNASFQNLSLLDFRNAQKQEQFVRVIDKILEQNPQNGEDIVAAWAHGLQIDQHQPVLLAHREILMSPDIIGAMDTNGVQNDVMVSDMNVSTKITFMVPATELGMLVYTFVSIKPDETLGTMPHPILSEPWGNEKMIEQEFLQDPVPVLGRQLDSSISQANETTVYMHVGHNGLKKAYVQYGLGRRLNPNTVQNRTAIWQYRIPLSVTPDSILYPPDISHYPFANNGDGTANPTEVFSVDIQSVSIIRTPMIEGPTPLEALSTQLSNIVEGN